MTAARGAEREESMTSIATPAQAGHDTYKWWVLATAVFGAFVSILGSFGETDIIVR